MIKLLAKNKHPNKWNLYTLSITACMKINVCESKVANQPDIHLQDQACKNHKHETYEFLCTCFQKK